MGNTFGATALSSYGGFWIAFAIILTPGGFNIQGAITTADKGSAVGFTDSFGLFLMVSPHHFSIPTPHDVSLTFYPQGWFIFTFILLLATLRSTVAFFSLFFTLDMAFLLLGIGYLRHDADGVPNDKCIIAGGVFGLLAAFLAWYNALAGILDDSNRLVKHAAFQMLRVLLKLFLLQLLRDSCCPFPLVSYGPRKKTEVGKGSSIDKPSYVQVLELWRKIFSLCFSIA